MVVVHYHCLLLTGGRCGIGVSITHFVYWDLSIMPQPLCQIILEVGDVLLAWGLVH